MQRGVDAGGHLLTDAVDRRELCDRRGLDRGESAEVLSENLRLWDLLTVDLAHPDNETDTQLASQLLTLARFVRHHTHMLYQGSGAVDILVEINTAILQGLLGNPGQAANAQSAA